MKYLDKISSPADIKKLNENQLDDLAGEIRNVLIDTVSKNGGHLASNLGVVEFTCYGGLLHLWLQLRWLQPPTKLGLKLCRSLNACKKLRGEGMHDQTELPVHMAAGEQTESCCASPVFTHELEKGR